MKNRAGLIVLSVFAFSSQLSAQNRKADDSTATRLIRISQTSVSRLSGFEQIGIDFSESKKDGRDHLVPADDRSLEKLQALGIHYSIEIENLKDHYQEQLAKGMETFSLQEPPLGFGSMGGYYTYAEIGQKLDELHRLFPRVIGSKISIGRSYESRDIWAVKLSDNQRVDGGRPKVFFDALHHAREPEGMMTLFHFMYEMGSNYGRDPFITQLLHSREIWCVPIVNPDGYVHNQTIAPNGGGMWRKNRRPIEGTDYIGVDLNRNYPVAWGGPGSDAFPVSDQFRGPSPLSEPETQALTTFYQRKGPFATGNSIHAYGELYLYPWGYTGQIPPLHSGFQALGNWHSLISGYTYGSTYSTIYPASGVSTDWAFQTMGTMAFTSEIGETFWPPMDKIVPTALENLESFKRLVASAGPFTRITNVGIQEFAGDGDGQLEAGEIGSLRIYTKNVGVVSSRPLEFSLQSNTQQCLVLQPTAEIPGSAPFSITYLPYGVILFGIDSTATAGSTLSLELHLYQNDFEEIKPVSISVGAN